MYLSMKFIHPNLFIFRLYNVHTYYKHKTWVAFFSFNTRLLKIKKNGILLFAVNRMQKNEKRKKYEKWLDMCYIQVKRDV